MGGRGFACLKLIFTHQPWRATDLYASDYEEQRRSSEPDGSLPICPRVASLALGIRETAMFAAMGLAAALALTPAEASAAAQAAQSAEQRDAEASVSQGVAAYQRGDYAAALALFRRAADQGNAGGQAFLGAMYKNGQGVPQNSAEAVRWYRLAAGQGHAEAQHYLGSMHNAGRGVLRNYVEAYKWYALSAAQGDTKAGIDRDEVLERMTPAQIAEAQRLVAEWRPR